MTSGFPLYISIFFFFLVLSVTPQKEEQWLIDQACKATRYPNTCKADLYQTHLSKTAKPVDIIKITIQISSQTLKTINTILKTIFAARGGAINTTTAVRNCLMGLNLSGRRLEMSNSENILNRRKKDARAWLSASLSYQVGCLGGLQYLNDAETLSKTTGLFYALINSTSNALSMMVSYDLFGNQMELWKSSSTERSGFWESSDFENPVLDFEGGFPAKSEADAIVCKSGNGCYRTIQEAVNAGNFARVGRGRYVVYIKEGIYEENVRISFEKKNIVFWGDGMGKTVITGSISVKPGIGTSNTATVWVDGDGFMARDLTIQNTAGSEARQAVAFLSNSDLSILYNCEILGYQDTLYANSLRQYYKSCRIAGTIDFIFGNAAAVFQDSVILVRKRQLSPEGGSDTNTISAQGRQDPAQSTGFVFQNCVINGTEDYMRLYYSNARNHKTYLGRPWKEYSRVVYIHSQLESLIRPEGWIAWNGDFALSTLYFGEYDNKGLGSNTWARVTWSNQIPWEHIISYSVHNFIQGDEWIPSKKL